MSGGREPAHVMADFGQDDAGTQLVDAGDRGQERYRGAKGFDIGVDLPIDLVDRRIKGVDLLKMQPQQEAVMPGNPAPQRRLQFVWCGFDPPVSQSRQSSGLGFTGDQRFDHAPAGQTDDVGDRPLELDIGVLQRLLQPLDMAAALAHQLLAGAQQIAHLLGLLIRYEATADQAVCQEIGRPRRVVHVSLAPRHVLNVSGVRQHQLKIAVAQDVPHRLPVDVGRLHGDMGTAPGGEPFRQPQQFFCGCLEGPHLTLDRAVLHASHASHNRVPHFREGRLVWGFWCQLI